MYYRVISGAPEDENQYQFKSGVEKAGAVYRCQTDPPHHCEQIPFDTSGKIILNFNFCRLNTVVVLTKFRAFYYCSTIPISLNDAMQKVQFCTFAF